MAEKTTELERVYTIPLRKARMGTRSRRADRAVRDVRAFLTRHMKSEEIWIATEVNEMIWTRGKYMVPTKIRVRATRFDDGVVEVTLPESEAVGSIREKIQERLEKAAETPVLVHAEPEAEEAGEEGEAKAKADDRPATAVAGIGPATGEKLKAAGIANLGALAAASPEAVAEATGRSVEQATEWIGMARDLVAGTGEAKETAQPAPEAAGEEE